MYVCVYVDMSKLSNKKGALVEKEMSNLPIYFGGVERETRPYERSEKNE